LRSISRRGGTSFRPFLLLRARRLRALAAGAILVLAVGTTVAAHGGAARIVVMPDPVNPGGVIEITGDDLSADDAIRLVLVTADGHVEMTTVTADGLGHVKGFVQLPADLPTGIYAIHAVDSTGAAIKAPLEVAGPPITDGGGDPGGRDEDDGLLVALPPGWQQSLSEPAVTAVPVTAANGSATSDRSVRDLIGVALGLGALLAVAAVLVAGLRRRAARRPVARPD
jgi:hypothetical protein